MHITDWKEWMLKYIRKWGLLKKVERRNLGLVESYSRSGTGGSVLNATFQETLSLSSFYVWIWNLQSNKVLNHEGEMDLGKLGRFGFEFGGIHKKRWKYLSSVGNDASVWLGFGWWIYFGSGGLGARVCKSVQQQLLTKLQNMFLSPPLPPPLSPSLLCGIQSHTFQTKMFQCFQLSVTMYFLIYNWRYS